MGRRAHEPLRPLTVEERAALGRMGTASSARRDQGQRAQALLAVAQGHSDVQAAAQAGYADAQSVSRLVRRFNQRGLAALAIAPGRGRRATYDGADRARIVAAAQREPDREHEGTATWSRSTLERALRQQGLTNSGATTIRRVLRAAGSSYQRTRTGCPTGTAIRTRKSGPVRVSDPQTEVKRGASSRRTG